MVTDRLKTETRALHDAIEQTPALARLLDADVRADEYVALLRCLWCFHAALEPRLEACLEAGSLDSAFSLAARRKTPLLARDLAHYAAPVPPAAPDDALPALPTTAHALGALYVVEGATLGGRLILRHLGRSLGVTQAEGAAYYAGYGERTGAMWKTFCALLDARLTTPEEGDAAVAGASALYRTLAAWLRP